jgi:hypothetical protein
MEQFNVNSSDFSFHHVLCTDWVTMFGVQLIPSSEFKRQHEGRKVQRPSTAKLGGNSALTLPCKRKLRTTRADTCGCQTHGQN